ncbi:MULTISPECIES: DUF4815 domain-containing protein [unclassified Wolbachia]|uniref:DUF4815 domain-containing protein n=1 Tax=unclassified Wolbachia TaxID=2640676 RepID=UPI00124FCAFC|nr:MULTISPECIES: DUF4815 domain-containing protein [unclassified Wolbachia]KAB2978021.1 DUF4815 domain-containing protein [Wolbachia endosymbiont of Nasonia oneida]MDU8921128.1 DUF4815 domain-containing protein [Wolbachia endosymbiont of Scaptomyza pallida]
MTLNAYYNRFNPDKGYEKSLFLAGRGLQSAELNETQEYALSKLKGIGDAIFRDGDVITGSNCIIDRETGKVTLEGGKIYLRGAVRKVREEKFVIPLNTIARIGIYYLESTITELEDENLRDPAVGTRNYQEVGAARLKVSTIWGYQAEGVSSPFSVNGEFYPIYNIENGVLIEHSPPPQANIVTTALARYDKEANGSYVVNGLEVMCLQREEGDEKGKKIFVINEGKAHVDGYEIELPHSIRVSFDEDPDIKSVESEPHTFQPNSQRVMELKVNDFPISEIKKVDITVQKTITITHGSYSGAIDPIPDSAVLEIIQIKQGNVIYENSIDYKLNAGNVDWSLPGKEPAPGSSYQITYRCRTHVSPEDISEQGCKVKGAVDNSLVLIDYTWKMPRFDLITIDSKGVVRRIKGISHSWRPSMPKAPNGQLLLCYIHQTWKEGEKVKVVNNAIHAVPMNELEAMKKGINDLYALVAEERLRSDANSREPTTKKGVFVDSFFDDDMRDQGIVQTAAIVNRELVLPIDVEVADIEKGGERYLLPYELEPVLEQLLQTKSEKINPYQAFDKVTAKITINKNIDHWTEVTTNWKSPVTRVFNTRETTELMSSNSYEAEFMREAVQNFEIEGFEPNEKLKEVKFDGIFIQPTA